jgi:peptidoglycan/LPS O-acetylase OafA/YrhL
MTNAPIRNTLFPRSISLGEAATLVATGSVVASALYNYGFFVAEDWNYVSLLSLQDLALGTLAALPIVLTMSVGGLHFFNDALHPDSRTSSRNLAIGVLGLCLVAGVTWFIPDNSGSILFYACAGILVAFAALMIAVKLLKPSRVFVIILVGIFLVALPVAIGAISFSERATQSNSSTTIVTFADNTRTNVKMMRVSSSYIFYYVEDVFEIAKLSDVKRLTELKVVSNG